VDAISNAYLGLVSHDHVEWLERWNASKQGALLRSWLTEDIVYGRTILSVKRELIAKFISKARGIQMYYNLATQFATGYMHAAFQKAVCTVFGKSGFEVHPGIKCYCASGWSAADVSEWASERAEYRYVYCFDGVNFDASVSVSLLLEKVRVMQQCGVDLAESARAGIVVKGEHRGAFGKIRYKNSGGTKSGFSDTTSGNTLLNLCVCAAAASSLRLRGHILALGDDLIAVFEQEPIGLSDAIHAYGFVPDARTEPSFARADFLSGHFLATPDGRWSFAPSISRLLQRMWWTVSPPSHKRIDIYRGGVASGLCSTYATHRLIRAHMRGRISDDLIPKNDHRPRGAQHRTVADYDFGLCERYGWSPAELRRVERVLTDARDGYNRSDLVDHIFEVDCAPPIPWEPREHSPLGHVCPKRIKRDLNYFTAVERATAQYRSNMVGFR